MRTRRFRAAGSETKTNQRGKASTIMSPQTEKEWNVEPVAESRRGCEAEGGSVK